MIKKNLKREKRVWNGSYVKLGFKILLSDRTSNVDT